jgi:hypothetical protein
MAEKIGRLPTSQAPHAKIVTNVRMELMIVLHKARLVLIAPQICVDPTPAPTPLPTNAPTVPRPAPTARKSCASWVANTECSVSGQAYTICAFLGSEATFVSTMKPSCLAVCEATAGCIAFLTTLPVAAIASCALFSDTSFGSTTCPDVEAASGGSPIGPFAMPGDASVTADVDAAGNSCHICVTL